MSWTELPVELIILIASLVDKRKDLGVLRLLSKRCNSIIQPVLWKNNTLGISTREIPNLLGLLESTSSSLPHFVTALLIQGPDPLSHDETYMAPLIHQVLKSLPELEVLYLTSLNCLYQDLDEPCPTGLLNIRNLHLHGTMKISPKDLHWCMMKMPRLVELEAWVQIGASALPVCSKSESTSICNVTHLKLKFWIQALFNASQNILFELISVPAHLKSLILYDISFYRYVPLTPLVNAISSSIMSLRHFELRQHVDSRVQIIDQFGAASFSHFSTLQTLVLPCMYADDASGRFPQQLKDLRFCSPAVLSWGALNELLLNKPDDLQRIAATVGISDAVLIRTLSGAFPRVIAQVRSNRKSAFFDGASVILDLSQM